MDDLPLIAEPAHERYLCPGERHPIDRAAHLGRLASFYPACRECRHRDDMRQLVPHQVRQWEEILKRDNRGPRFTSEGLEADSVNHVDTGQVGRFATAVAIALWQRHERTASPPTVMVGADGHWTTAELLAAACGAVELAGCRAVEVGATTTPALATAVGQSQADAAVWIGNATRRLRGVELRAWGAGGCPWSTPGELKRVREIFDGRIDRPKRRGGGRDRMSAEAGYLDPLRPQFHALRPLRFVLDTTSQPVVRYLQALVADAACAMLRPAVVKSDAAAPIEPEPLSSVEYRLQVLTRDVVADGAHFGLWIDGAGEAFRVVDERGRAVDTERLFKLLAKYVLGEQSDATIVLEPQSSSKLRKALEHAGAQIATGGTTRQGMYEAMGSAGATIGGGPSGTVWFSGSPPLPDALLATSLLLKILSQSDRAISEVLDDGGSVE